MKKVAIITLHGYNNYGNRLQNYATQEILIHLGFSVDTLVNIPKTISKESIIKKLNNITTIHDFIDKVNKKIKNKIWLSRYKDLMNYRTQIKSI